MAGAAYAAPVQSPNGTTVPSAVNAEAYAGYSYWSPHATLGGSSFNADAQGMVFGGSYFLNRFAGVQFEAERQQQTSTEGMRSFSAGPVIQLPHVRGLAPFTHVLVGAAEVTGPNQPTIGGSSYYYNREQWGPAVTVGGGVDLATPFLRHSLTLRLVEADYQFIHENFGPVQHTSGGTVNLQALRLSAGVAYRFNLPGTVSRLTRGRD